MKQLRENLNVPVELCMFSLRERRIRETMLYLFLKYSTSGYVKKNSVLFKSIPVKLGICVKTSRKYLAWLVEAGWLIPSEESNSYRIVSYKVIAKKQGFIISTGAILAKEDLLKYKSFAVAATLLYQIKRNQRRRFAELKSRSSSSLPRYPHFSYTCLSKNLSISKATAINYVKSAVDDNFLTVETKLEYIGLSEKHLYWIRKYADEDTDKMRRLNGRIYYQLPNRLDVHIYLRTKKELIEIIKKNYEEKN